MRQMRICSRQRTDEQVRRSQGVINAIITIKQDDGREGDGAPLDKAVGRDI